MLPIRGGLKIKLMVSSITDQQSFGAESQMTEPHFDEEATLLSARPVVPLKTVTAQRFSRSWKFGLALAGALLIGVVATAFYYTRLKTESLTGADSQTISSGAEASSTLSDSANGSPETVAGVSVEPAAARAKSPTESSKKTVVRRVTNTDDALRNRERDARYAEDDRAAWRAERREAKERKRRERDDLGIKPSDDLLRIREIFEGRRKP